LFQDLIPGGMSQTVVDRLEPVQVKEQGHLLPLPMGLTDGLAQPVGEQQAVG
jgi:hypothetical protein